jgi:hypothetical protein
MPANIPGIATKVPQSKLYIGLFSDHRVHIDVKQYDRPSAILCAVQRRQGWPGLLDNA